MSHVSLVDASRAPLLARPYFETGDPGPIVRALAHVPELLEVTIPFVSSALSPSAIGFRTKELVILRASALQGCRYCTQTHAAVALEAGLETRQIRALMQLGSAASGFGNSAERALIEWVEAVVGREREPGAEAMSDMKRHFAEAEIVELSLLAGATVMLNIFCTTLDLPTAPGALRRLEAEGLL